MKKRRPAAPGKQATAAAECPGKLSAGIAVAVLLFSVVLLFAQLGHYAFWDDEAGLAIPARGVWHTGDTSIVIGHNINAPRQGVLVRDLKDRVNPPLPAYIMAPFAGHSGTSSLLPRLPFAVCGLMCIGLILWWLRRERATTVTWILMALAILGNVSFFLYFRQARYYGITLLCSVAIAYTYLHWNGSRKGLLAMSLLLLAVLSSHYMTFAALAGAMAVDYLLWQRKVRKLSLMDWLVLLAPVVVLGSIVVITWNPLLSGITKQAAENNFADRLTLFWWNLRDLNRGEFAVGILLLLAPMLYFSGRKNLYLLRGTVCIGVYCFVMAMVSPQPVNQTLISDVRYLIPLIPLSMALAVAVIGILTRRAPAWVAIAFGLVAFWTNLLNGGPLLPEGFRSTLRNYAGELLDPPSDPYTAAAKWINDNVSEDESIWVLPDYMNYPLMYHAPKAVYAWQLKWPPEPQFKDLPAIHFQGRVPPNYIIAFGPVVQQVRQMIAGWQNSGYQQIATIDCFWHDEFRPELFWRSFKTRTGHNPDTDIIYVFKRKSGTN
jgi:hypothetical protein